MPVARSSQAKMDVRAAGTPELSVVLPLAHAHGDAIAFLETWTAQTLERSRYQIVIAAPADAEPALIERASALLGAGDRLIVGGDTGNDEIPLWNAAARAASAPWLLISEAHCIAAPTCLRAVIDAIATAPDATAALTIEHDNMIDSLFTALGARWMDEIEALRFSAPWRPVVQIGTAIRAEAFAALGGLDERAGMFSMALLGARLHEAGLAMGHVGSRQVTHVFEPTPRDAKEMTIDFTRGESAIRSLDDPAHFERLFGHVPEWEDRMRFRSATARVALRAMLRGACASPNDAGWLAGETARWLPVALGGARPYVLAAALREHANRVLTGSRLAGEDRRYRAFLRWHDAIVRGARLRWQQREGVALPPVRVADGVYPVEELDATLLVGGQGLEHWEGQAFRWLAPVAIVRVAPAGRCGTLTVDTLGIRGNPLSYVAGVFAGTARVGHDALSGDERFLRIRLGARLAGRARGSGIVIVSRPLRPEGGAAPDPRRLGIPVAAIEARSAMSEGAGACA